MIHMVELKDVVEYSVDYALSKNIDKVISRYHRKKQRILEILNGKLTKDSSYLESGVGVRIFNNGIYIHLSTNIPSIESIKQEIDNAYKVTRVVNKNFIRGLYPLETDAKDVSYILKEDRAFEDYQDILIDFLLSLDREITNYKEVSILTRLFRVTYIDEERYIVTSDGGKIFSRIPRILVTYTLTGKGNGSYISRTGMFGVSGGIGALNYEYMKKEIKNDVKVMHNILFSSVAPPEGEINIVVGNEVAGIIAHEAIGHPFEADRIIGMEGAQAGESYISINSIGDSIASREVTVLDDPTLPSTYGFYIYDDDGVPSSRRVLIKEGIVEGFLHNLITGYLTGAYSNGSARSESYRDEPLVRMGVTFFEPGDYKFDELISEVKHGIYVRSFTEWNIDDLRLNQRYVGYEAYLIKNGEIGDPLKYPVIETNTYNLLRSLVARSEEIILYPGLCGKGDPMQIVPVSFGGPHMLFENIRVLRR